MKWRIVLAILVGFLTLLGCSFIHRTNKKEVITPVFQTSALPTSISYTPSPETHLLTPTITPTPTATPTVHKTSIFYTVQPRSPTPTSFPTFPPSLSLKDLPTSYIVYDTEDGLGYISPDGNVQITIIKNDLYFDPSWSPDGHWIAFTYAFGSQSNQSKTEIAMILKDGSNLTFITRGPYYKGEPAWSPDGQYIVYTEMADGLTSDLVITRVDGSLIWKLTNMSNSEVNPVWSPDGKKIAFLHDLDADSEVYPRNYYLYVIDVNNRESVQLNDIPVNGGLDWSPDGKEIVFLVEGDQGNWQIYVVGEDGKNLRKVTDFPGRVESPQWSPDGKWIAFIGIQGDYFTGKRGIYITNIDGTQTVEITHEGHSLLPRFIDWSPVPALQVGESYTITPQGANLNVHSTPSARAKILSQLPDGGMVTVLEGPVDAENYYWWKIRTSDGLEGWVVDFAGWYTLSTVTQVTETPEP